MSDKYIRKVQGLLDKAAATEHEEERNTLLAKADELMAKYAIEQSALDMARAARGESRRLKVEHMTLVALGDQAENIMNMMWHIGNLTGVKGIFVTSGLGYHHESGKNRTDFWSVRFYGFRSDLDYLERLNALLQIAIYREISPVINPDETFDHNVYRLHEAGIKWVAIKDALNASAEKAGWETVPWPDGKRLIKAYKRECERLGIPSHAVLSSKGYRDSFMHGFRDAVSKRISESRQEASKTAGTALVLVDKAAQINDVFEAANPDRKTLAKTKSGRMDAEGARRGHSAGSRADLGGKRFESARRAISD